MTENVFAGLQPVGAGHAREKMFAGMARSYT